MWHIFWRGYSRLRSGREHWAWMVVVEVRQGTLGGDTRGWGVAGNTGRGWSWLRSGKEHWAWMVVVEVRQGTLGVAGRGWGQAGNTGRGWSWLRSGREHCGSRVAVGRGGRRGGRRGGGRRGGGGGRGGEEERRRRRTRQEEATDIKSNNPHLAGGEKNIHLHHWIVLPNAADYNLIFTVSWTKSQWVSHYIQWKTICFYICSVVSAPCHHIFPCPTYIYIYIGYIYMVFPCVSQKQLQWFTDSIRLKSSQWIFERFFTSMRPSAGGVRPNCARCTRCRGGARGSIE